MVTQYSWKVMYDFPNSNLMYHTYNPKLSNLHYIMDLYCTLMHDCIKLPKEGSFTSGNILTQGKMYGSQPMLVVRIFHDHEVTFMTLAETYGVLSGLLIGMYQFNKLLLLRQTLPHIINFDGVPVRRSIKSLEHIYSYKDDIYDIVSDCDIIDININYGYYSDSINFLMLYEYLNIYLPVLSEGLDAEFEKTKSDIDILRELL